MLRWRRIVCDPNQPGYKGSNTEWPSWSRLSNLLKTHYLTWMWTVEISIKRGQVTILTLSFTDWFIIIRWPGIMSHSVLAMTRQLVLLSSYSCVPAPLELKVILFHTECACRITETHTLYELDDPGRLKSAVIYSQRLLLLLQPSIWKDLCSWLVNSWKLWGKKRFLMVWSNDCDSKV